MNTLPQCPQCNAANIYEYAGLYACPDCSYEWSSTIQHSSPAEESDVFIVRDVNGVELKDGDTVMVIKDLKVKGSSSSLKSGTKVKNIRLVHSDHNIDCKIPGIGSMGLKSEFVRKVAE